MMKKILPLTLMLTANVFASSVNMKQGEVYKGQEEINEQRTGRYCLVTVYSVEESPKGLHCYDIAINILHVDLKLPISLELKSRVTNSHRTEYPGLKTCAVTIDGSTSTDEIYSSDPSSLVTSFFAGAHKGSKAVFDYFLSVSRENKKPHRTRVHVTKLFSEKNYDCVDLEKIDVNQ